MGARIGRSMLTKPKVSSATMKSIGLRSKDFKKLTRFFGRRHKMLYDWQPLAKTHPAIEAVIARAEKCPLP